MRKVIMLVLAGAVLGSNVATAKEMKGKFALGLNLGANIPTGDFGNEFKVGGVADLTGEYYLSNVVALGVEVEGSVNDPKSDVAAQFPGVDISATISSFNATGRFFFPSQSVEPYVIAGLGAYTQELDLEVSGFVVKVSETDFGIHGGAGINFPVSPKVGILAEADFHNIFSKGSSTNFVNVKAGVRLLLGGKKSP